MALAVTLLPFVVTAAANAQTWLVGGVKQPAKQLRQLDKATLHGDLVITTSAHATRL